jgi:SAM-dependent methyltransferase
MPVSRDKYMLLHVTLRMALSSPHHGSDEDEHEDEHEHVVLEMVSALAPAHFKVSNIQFGRHCVQIKKLTRSQGCTPFLDRTACSCQDDNDDGGSSHIFHPIHGTGQGVSLASLTFLHLLEEGGDGEASLLASYFDSKRVLELACGTGISGIATLVRADPLHVTLTLTDPDEVALELVKENCKLNRLDASQYDVQWLDLCHNRNHNRNNDKLGTFQTVLATHVLYRLDTSIPLLATAFGFLQEGGHLALSHVPHFGWPRQAQDESTPSEATTATCTQNNHQESSTATATALSSPTTIVELQECIVTQALAQGFIWQETIRPDQVLMELPCDDDGDQDTKHVDANTNTVDDWDESSGPLTLDVLRQAHAVLFVFVKHCM